MGRTVQELTYRLIADEKALVSGLKAAGKKTAEFSQKATALGSTLTKNVTLPIVAVGAAMIKLATDSGKAADRLLDLEQITGLSTDTLQELDIVAAEAGVSAEGLARSIQRFSQRLPQLESGTGNSAEALKTLGVNLRDSNGQIRTADELLPDFIRSLEQVESTVERNALAQQIFGRSLDDLAPVIGLGADEFDRLRQSARDSGLVISKDALEAANAYRAELDQMNVRLQRARQEIGQELLPVITSLIPIFEDAVGVVIRAFQAFTNLDEGTQKTILAMGGLIALAGPTALAIGKISAALAFLAANPVVAVVAGLGALVAVMIRVRQVKHENDVKSITEEYGELATSIGLAEKEMVAFVELLEGAIVRDAASSWGDIAEVVRNIAESYDVNLLKATDLALANKELTNEQREQLLLLRQQASSLEIMVRQDKQRGQSMESLYRFGGQVSRELANQERAARAAAVEEQKRREEFERQQVIERERLALREQLGRVDSLAAAGLIKETEALEEKIEIRKAIIEQAKQEVRQGEITAAQARQIANEQIGHINRYESRLEDLKIVVEDVREIEKRSIEEIDLAREELTRRLLQQSLRITDDAREQAAIQLQILENQYQNEINKKELSVDEQISIDQYYANERQRIEEQVTEALAEERRKQFEDAVAVFNQLAGYINQISGQIFQNQKDYINANVEDEEERAKKIAEIERKQAAFNKLTSAVQAAIDTAAAVAKALPNIPLSIAIGALGAFQVGAILAQPLPPVPSFRSGGSFTVPPGFSDDSFSLPAAMVQSGERVTVETAEQQAVSRGGGGGAMNIIVVDRDGREQARQTVEYINNGEFKVELGA